MSNLMKELKQDYVSFLNTYCIKAEKERGTVYNSMHEGWGTIREEWLEFLSDFKSLETIYTELETALMDNSVVDTATASDKLLNAIVNASCELTQVLQTVIKLIITLDRNGFNDGE